MLCGRKYAPDFILQTHITVNEHIGVRGESRAARGGERLSLSSSPFSEETAAHYNIGFPLSCHYQTLSLKADPKDRQSIRRQSSHLYLLNVLMSSIFRPRGFASGY